MAKDGEDRVEFLIEGAAMQDARCKMQDGWSARRRVPAERDTADGEWAQRASGTAKGGGLFDV